MATNLYLPTKNENTIQIEWQNQLLLISKITILQTNNLTIKITESVAENFEIADL